MYWNEFADWANLLARERGTNVFAKVLEVQKFLADAQVGTQPGDTFVAKRSGNKAPAANLSRMDSVQTGYAVGSAVEIFSQSQAQWVLGKVHAMDLQQATVAVDAGLGTGNVAHRFHRTIELRLGLAQVDDVDAVALAVDVRPHLRVPSAGALAKVDACFDEVLNERIPSVVCHAALPVSATPAMPGRSGVLP